MLNDVLTDRQKSFFTKKHQIALEYYGQLCKETPKNLKWKFVYPLRKAGFSQKDAVKFGFGTSYKLWRKVKEDRINDRKKGGMKKISKK